jgi:hypothetical protein
MSGQGGIHKLPAGIKLLPTLLWTIVKIAKALKDFHGEE